MRVARLHAAGDLRLTDEPDPVPGPGESLVRVSAVGLCGSDLHWWTEGAIGDAVLTRPVVPGHEFGGVVIGGELDGRLVAVDPAIPCGGCEQCLEGNRNLCPRVKFAGHASLDGPMRELITWPTDRMYPLPDGFTGADAAVLEPLGVALHAVDLAHLRPAATVAVVGLGPIGLLALQVARASGATRVVGVDPLAHRAAAALRYGAASVAAPAELATASARADLLGGHGEADVVIETAGTDDAVALCVRLARPGARVMLAGIPDHDRTAFPAGEARRKGLTLVMVRRMKETYPRAIALVRQGLVDVRSLVTATYPLDEAAAAFAAGAARGGLKVVVEPNRA